MKAHLITIARFLALLMFLPVVIGGIACVVWDYEIGLTVATFVLCGLIDFLFYKKLSKKWTKK